ncbi:MAG TPA: Spy/CpxP family protein refolding chaperone [Candidatus Acidoferrales bacterium]
MKLRNAMVTGMVVVTALAAGLYHAAAQEHQHPAGAAGQSAEMNHHAFLDMERGAIERGEGFGMALAADKAGFPGPKHVLEMKAELKLTAEQEASMQKLMAAMKEKAVAKGREILDAETKLEEMFRAAAAPADLRAQTGRIASLRAELRWVHLETHLAARPLLTEWQLMHYQHTRHGGH